MCLWGESILCYHRSYKEKVDLQTAANQEMQPNNENILLDGLVESSVQQGFFFYFVFYILMVLESEMSVSLKKILF